jgi:hypothetical protein
MAIMRRDVRLTPKSEHWLSVSGRPLLGHKQTSALSVGFEKTAGVPLLLQIKHQVWAGPALVLAVLLREVSSMPSFLGWFCCQGK